MRVFTSTLSCAPSVVVVNTSFTFVGLNSTDLSEQDQLALRSVVSDTLSANISGMTVKNVVYRGTVPIARRRLNLSVSGASSAQAQVLCDIVLPLVDFPQFEQNATQAISLVMSLLSKAVEGGMLMENIMAASGNEPCSFSNASIEMVTFDSSADAVSLSQPHLRSRSSVISNKAFIIGAVCGTSVLIVVVYFLVSLLKKRGHCQSCSKNDFEMGETTDKFVVFVSAPPKEEFGPCENPSGGYNGFHVQPPLTGNE